MFKMIVERFKAFKLDPLSLGAIAAVLPLTADLVWLHLDWSTSEFHYHFVYILFSFVVSTILSAIALIWYHKSKDKPRDLEKRIEYLEQLIKYNKITGKWPDDISRRI